MSDLMTDSQQQTNSRVFKSPLVSFSTVTGSGRFVSGMKQFRDANPDLCNEVTEQKAWAISPTVVQITEGFNSREMGMGEAYYQLPEVADHLNNIKNAYIRGDYVDPRVAKSGPLLSVVVAAMMIIQIPVTGLFTVFVDNLPSHQ